MSSARVEACDKFIPGDKTLAPHVLWAATVDPYLLLHDRQRRRVIVRLQSYVLSPFMYPTGPWLVAGSGQETSICVCRHCAILISHYTSLSQSTVSPARVRMRWRSQEARV